ncbi:MAG: hypothetical protein A3E88_06425 [Legionellales bacterium RIFCSPHIGHO2_12_FULL_35_11]|nr:MAG: hypothetical protein A3E88_06425 [Legionellales bacterium RIFCSPHIGHO2_12_FULL_35_11]
MSSIEKTAYPRFPKRRKIKSTELSNSYSLRDDEIKKSIYRHRQKIREFLNVERWGYDDVDGKSSSGYEAGNPICLCCLPIYE